ncbi:PspC domain-containing protein [Enterococcus sp. AZ109]|uniref:PspC domain-containing protein n=1 Tax=Enterococcus sp. AZ109 TaxID=2774634 RepID=UPI003F27CE70
MKKLRKSPDKIISGVCAGFADFFGTSPLLFRLLFLFPGMFMAYIILAVMLPSADC